MSHGLDHKLFSEFPQDPQGFGEADESVSSSYLALAPNHSGTLRLNPSIIAKELFVLVENKATITPIDLSRFESVVFTDQDYDLAENVLLLLDDTLAPAQINIDRIKATNLHISCAKIALGITTHAISLSEVDRLSIHTTDDSYDILLKDLLIRNGALEVKSNIQKKTSLKSPHLNYLSLKKSDDSPFLQFLFKLYRTPVDISPARTADGMKIEAVFDPETSENKLQLVLDCNGEAESVTVLGYPEKQDKTVVVFDSIRVNTTSKVEIYWTLKVRHLEITGAPSLLHRGDIYANQIECTNADSLIYMKACEAEQILVKGLTRVSFEGPADIKQFTGEGGVYVRIHERFKCALMNINRDLPEDFIAKKSFGLCIEKGHRSNKTGDLPAALRDNKTPFIAPLEEYEKYYNVVFGEVWGKFDSFEINTATFIKTLIIKPCRGTHNVASLQIAPGEIQKVRIESFVSSSDLYFQPHTGSAQLVITDSARMLSGGDQTKVVNSFQNFTAKNGMIFTANHSILISGGITSDQGPVKFFSHGGDILAPNAAFQTKQEVMMAAPNGAIYSTNSTVNSKSLIQYAGKGVISLNSEYMLGSQLLAYTLAGQLVIKGKIQTDKSDVLLVNERGNIILSNTQIGTGQGQVLLSSGAYTMINGCKLEGTNVVTESLKSFFQTNTAIKANAQSIALLTEPVGENNEGNLLANYGIKITTPVFDGQVVALVAVETEQQLSNLIFQKCPVIPKPAQTGNITISGRNIISSDSTLAGDSNFVMQANDNANLRATEIDANKVYIESSTGTIAGVKLRGNEAVVIKMKESFYTLPLAVHNALLENGGYQKGWSKTGNLIMAGTVDIDVGKYGRFLSTVFKGVKGRIAGNWLDMVDQATGISITDTEEHRIITHIKVQQQRYRTLERWGMKAIQVPQTATTETSIKARTNSTNISSSDGVSLQFTELTQIEGREQPINIYYPFRSRSINISSGSGDIYIDKPLTGYDIVAIHNKAGKILIGSHNLDQIYAGLQDSEQDRLPMIKANHVYLEGSQVVNYGSKLEVSGMIKIVGHNGVHMLPISVHNSYSAHHGKTRSREEAVRLVISEIKAGMVDLSGGKVLEIVSTLIKATGVKLSGQEVELVSDREIYEKHIWFTGRRKVYGGRNSWESHDVQHMVMPTILQTKNLVINGQTTLKAAQIYAENIAIEGKGDITFINDHNLHLYDYKCKKVGMFKFGGGKCTVYSKKTTKHMLAGTDVMPTIICVQGVFYGYASGEFHVLGTHIEGKEVYLIAPQGVKLEAAHFEQEKFVYINEKAARVGFSVSSKEASFGGDLSYASNRLRQQCKIHFPSSIVADKLVIHAKKGDIDFNSVRVQFKTADLQAKNWNVKALYDETFFDSVQKRVGVGIHVGIQQHITESVDQLKYLLTKEGNHPVEHLDRILNAYSLYKQTGSMLNGLNKTISSGKLSYQQLVTIGMYIGVNASINMQSGHTTQAVDNILRGGTLRALIEHDTRFEGIQMQVENLELVTENLFAKASANTIEMHQETMSVSMTVPIPGYNINMTPSASMAAQTADQEAIIYNNNFLTASGTMILRVSNRGEIHGVKFVASKLDVEFGNLLVGSLQDVIKNKLEGMSLSLGMPESGGISASPFGIKGNAKKQWTNQVGMLIGTQVANVAVKETLEIAGGIIANAEIGPDGKVTDKGNLQLRAAQLLVKIIEDFDSGTTLGIGTVFSAGGRDSKNNKNGIELESIPLKVEYKDMERTVHGAIGKGNVNISEGTGSVNRDTAEWATGVDGTQFTGKMSVPIGDMMRATRSSSSTEEGQTVGSKDNSPTEPVEDAENPDEIIDESDAKSTNESEAKPTSKPGAKPSDKPASKPGAKPSNKPASKPGAKPVNKPASKPEAKHSNKPASKPRAKPVSRPADKPGAKPASKPVTRHTETFASSNEARAATGTAIGSEHGARENGSLDDQIKEVTEQLILLDLSKPLTADKITSSQKLVIRYYDLMIKKGVDKKYHTMARDVAANEGFAGIFANSFLKESALKEGKKPHELVDIVAKIRISLAVKDYNARIGPSPISPLHYRNIHKEAFGEQKLSLYCWSGLGIELVSGPASWINLGSDSLLEVAETYLKKIMPVLGSHKEEYVDGYSVIRSRQSLIGSANLLLDVLARDRNGLAFHFVDDNHTLDELAKIHNVEKERIKIVESYIPPVHAAEGMPTVGEDMHRHIFIYPK